MMLRLSLITTVLLMSSTTFSAITLSLPEEIKLVAVNDQEIKTSLFNSANNYTLDAGQHQLNVRYTEYFQHHDSSHDILRSGIISIQTPLLQEGQKYSLALINPPKDFDTAQKYKNQPIIGLYDANKQLLVQQQGAQDAVKPWFGGINLTSNSVDLTTTAKAQPAAVYTQAAVITQPQANQTLSSSSRITKNTEGTDQALIQLWQQANKTERQKFMSWLAEQTN